MKLEAKDPRLVLKTAPPKVSKTLLARKRLSLHAPELTGKSVIAVKASSGFGKTSLLAQWRKEVLASGGIVAWLTLDPWDDDSRFAHGLAVAMQVASGRPRFGESFLRATTQPGGQHTALTCWLAEVLSLGAEVMLVLDDMHLLSPSTTTDSLLYLLHNAPANLRIVLSSRKPLQLQVANLLGHGHFASLDAEDLRFTLSETISLLSTRLGARIDLASCAHLHERTEGWPLGLQLAIAQVEKSVSVKNAIAKNFVHSGDVRRYFFESLIDQFEQNESEFLINVSFLDAIHPELCQAVTHYPNSEVLLKHLIEVTPIIGEGIGSAWHRIHPLAREFLQERFEAQEAHHKQLLRERAMHWLVEHEIYEEAARLALQSGQPEYAYMLAEQCLYDVLKAGEHYKVSAWIERIPQCEITNRPRLKLAVAWAFAMSDRHIEAAQMVHPLMEDSTVDDSLRCESAEICATAAFFADDANLMHSLIAPWLNQLTSYPPFLHAVGSNHRAILTLWEGKPDKARSIFELLPISGSSRGDYASGWRDWIIGLSYLWEGQALVAEESLRATWLRAEKTLGHRSPVETMLGIALAAALWDCDRHDEIPSLLAGRQGLLEHYSAPDALILGYVTTARISTSRGEERRAYAALDRLFALGEQRHLPRLCITSLAEQMRLHALQGHQDACAVVAGRIDNWTEDASHQSSGCLQTSLIRIQLGLARSHYHAAHQQWKQVLELANVTLPLTNALQRGQDRIQLQLLKALAMKRCGLSGEGLLAEAWSMAQVLGLARILQDTHPDLDAWFLQTTKSAVTTPVNQPVHAPKAPQPNLPQSALLTSKEREVLELLTRNMSNKEIALAMAISSETVKWHMKNLFDKLQAANRKHLLHRAQMLGVLDNAI